MEHWGTCTGFIKAQRQSRKSKITFDLFIYKKKYSQTAASSTQVRNMQTCQQYPLHNPARTKLNKTTSQIIKVQVLRKVLLHYKL